MSFWKLAAKTLAAAPTDGINGILAPLTHLDAPAKASTLDNDDNNDGDDNDERDVLSSADVAAHHKALDALLAEPDLLSEIKSGTNQRLTDFLARKEVVLRLGGWVVSGLGRGFPADTEPLAGDENAKGAALESGLVPDEMEAGRVPDEILQAAERPRTGMGGVPHPAETEQDGAAEEDDATEAEAAEARKRANFPRLSTEILVSAAPSLSDTLFRHESACTKPHTCPHPADFLLPFWESVLGSTEAQLASRAQQIGFWARVNGVLLDGPLSSEVLAHILKIPHLPARLLALLPTCSPLNDVLLLLLRVSRPPSPLIPTVVVQAIRMLEPFSALGRPGHTAAEDLLRGIIEICIAVPQAQAGPGAGGPAGGAGGVLGGPGGQDEAVFEWRDTTLARHIADEKSVRTLLDWILADIGAEPPAQRSIELGIDSVSEQESTPKPAGSGFETPTGSSAEQAADSLSPAELRTSSLLSSLAVLIDLIRKNNSDFVEQQMLTWARRRQAAEEEREMLEAEGAEAIGRRRSVNGVDEADDKGPAVVDLGVMLLAVAHRLPDFQRLLKTPRTPTAPRRTASGLLPPLTLERFRICEFYAELLHCSNMSLLNRAPRFDGLHAASGHLARGWQGVDDLAAALAASQPSDAAVPASLDLSSPDLAPAADNSYSSLIVDSLDTARTSSDDGRPDSAPSTPTTAESTSRRRSTVSQSSAPSEDREPPLTPSVYSVMSRNLPLPPPSPGQLLKTKFIQHRVIPSMIQLFFDFPWNNFLHSVVFDVLQQIFQGRLDRTLDRQLAESVFVDGRLCHLILEGQKKNDEAAAERTNMRFGYMGHLCLIAEAVVKLFERYPDLAAAVSSSVPQPEWDEYVATTLRQARERDMTSLSSPGLNLSVNKAPSASSLSDEDDEFPMNSSRTARATDAVITGSGAVVGAREAGSASGDQFSRYLADELVSDRTVGSSDEDDDDDGWFSGPRKMSAGDGDFAFETPDRATQQFGFDDRFEEAGLSAFRANGFDSDEDAEWAPFEAASSQSGLTATSQPASGFSSFETSFDPTPSNGNADADDFGDFEAAESGPSIVLPSMDQFEDFDLGEESRPPAASGSGFGGAVDLSASGAVAPAGDEDGSEAFGRLSLGDASTPASPHTERTAALPATETSDQSAEADEDDLGPALHPGAHLTGDGQVEAEVEGRTIRVPADDIIMTSRRNSLESRHRSNSLESGKS
ncbi:hypothetical protein JCM10908_004376 [Rhodotorula pacifica]|uniref:uncharacterized protein n=1 Tax=Rhodotorula pacifica TaxID=1495444 RepID=UPI0031739604